MTTFTTITPCPIPSIFATPSQSAFALGNNFNLIPKGQPMTVSEVRAKVAPHCSIQQVSAYLWKAVLAGLWERKKQPTGEYRCDDHGNLHPIYKAFFTRL